MAKTAKAEPVQAAKAEPVRAPKIVPTAVPAGRKSWLSGLKFSLPSLPKPAPKPVQKSAQTSQETTDSAAQTAEAVRQAKRADSRIQQRPKAPNPFSAYRMLWEGLLKYNDNEFPPRLFAIYLFAGSLALGVAVAALFFAKDTLLAIGAVLGTAIVVHVFAYTQMILSANSRASKVEDVLPDFLSLVASNIRSGLTPDKALVVSARDEFGPLTVEINKAAKQSITGMPLEQVMMGMTEHVRSNVLEKTMVQIVEGMHSGGDLSELLEKTALDIRKFRSVKKEVSSIILNYELFIIAAITFGAPMLYGVSTFLVDIMLIIKTKIGGGAEAMSQLSGSVGIFKGKLLLTPEGVQLFSVLAILITVFFGCMAVGVMGTGKRVDGLKYFPILALIGLAILFGIRFGLGSVLGGMLSGTG